MADTTNKRKRGQTKDRVLQARIPVHLDEELRSRAEQLGLSVSTVVRNVLLNTFNLVEGVVTDSSGIARALAGRVHSPVPGNGDKVEVIAWQEVTLNLNGICDKCNAILPAGERAAMGVPSPARPTLLCLECLTALSSAPENRPKANQPGKGKARPARAARAAKKTTNR